MAKRTAPAAHQRPALTVVPKHRRTARTVAVLAGLVFMLMAGAAAFQTQLARRQLELDQVNQEMDLATNTYERLRSERAQLRSPGRLAAEALALGMVPGDDTEFVSIDPDVVAVVQMSTGTMSDDVGGDGDTEIEQRSKVKEVVGGNP
jgi:hypothetical protein